MPVSALKGLPADRRGAVAVWAALSLPTLLLAAGLGLEVSQWLLARMELQRVADIAADAGALRYGQTYDTSQAVTVATQMAELNGVDESDISVLVGTGLRDPTNDEAVTVTVSRSVPASFSRLIGLTATTVSATASAETWGASANPPACVLTLGGQSSGVTEQPDITDTGGANLTLQGCSLRSDAGISVSGGVNLTANGVYASGSLSVSGGSKVSSTSGVYTGGAISVSGSGQVLAASSVYAGSSITSQNGTVHADSGVYATGTITTPKYDPTEVRGDVTTQANTSAGPTITQEADPYAGVLTDAETAMEQGTPVSWSNNAGTTTPASAAPQPGTVYSSWKVQGNVTLQPGLYIVTGGVSVSSGGSLSGTGVTIVTGSGVTLNGGGTLALSAPSTGQPGITGIVLGSLGSQGVSFSGGGTAKLKGIMYFPNAPISISGGSMFPFSGSNCLEMISSTLSVSGGVQMGGNCYEELGAPSIPSLASTPVTLVR